MWIVRFSLLGEHFLLRCNICIPVEVHQHFKGTNCLNLQSQEKAKQDGKPASWWLFAWLTPLTWTQKHVFLWSTSELLLDYTALHPRRYDCSWSALWEPNIQILIARWRSVKSISFFKYMHFMSCSSFNCAFKSVKLSLGNMNSLIQWYIPRTVCQTVLELSFFELHPWMQQSWRDAWNTQQNFH